MWFRKASPRRLAIRQDMAEAESLVPARARPSGHIFLIALVFFLVAAAMQFWPGDSLPYREGDIAAADIHSPAAFTDEDTTITDLTRDALRKTSPAVLISDNLAFTHIHNQLVTLKQDIQQAHSLSEVPPEDRARFPGLTDAALKVIQGTDSNSYAAQIDTIIYSRLAGAPIITPQDAEIIRVRPTSRVALAPNKKIDEFTPENPESLTLVIGSIGKAQQDILGDKLFSNGDLSNQLKSTILSYLAQFPDPTYHFDAKLTKDLADLHVATMKPSGRPYNENDVLIARGSKITASDYHRLKLAQAALYSNAAQENPWSPWLSRLGRISLALILTLAGCLYIVRMSKVARTLSRGWAVCGLLLLALLVARIIANYAPLMGIAPTLLAAFILSLAYSQRFALGITALHGLLVTITLGQNLDFFLILLTGCAVFSFGLSEIRSLVKLVEVGALACAAIFLTVWALGLSRVAGSLWSPWIVATDFRGIEVQSLWAVGAAAIVAMVAVFILPAVERTFRITTAMTLLNWCDASKPLLRRLSQEASGTFNHSLMVGNMAESAGNAIGANGLLCRVGAYYHDIGKLSKPQYFIENLTSGGPNRHDKLSPAMSLLIIVGHVKDGIELAREYGLPNIIHQFIGQHHGTTLVEYFFHAAKRKQEREGDDAPEISDTEFRYPGPKPQTREAAIVMICDGCESIVRAIDEPTAGRIETAVHNMIMKRLMDGQFSDCDLTLHDLSIIEETLVRTLAGIYHGRISYPAADKPLTLSQPA